MPLITFSEKDLLRGKVVTPSWYRVRIDDIGESPAASGKTTNYPIDGVILFNGENGSTEFAGVPTPAGWMFNSGAIGFATEFLKQFGVDVKAGQRYDLGAAVGKEIDVFIENDVYQGRQVNRINHKYRAIKPEVKAAA